MIAPEKSLSLDPHESEFTEAVLTQLIQTILGAASCVELYWAIDQPVMCQLLKMAQQDAAFARWLLAEFGYGRQLKTDSASIHDSIGVEASSIERNSMDGLNWEDFLRAVLCLNQASALAGVAKQAASLALRLRTLQHRYRTDLERSHREFIYQLAYGLSHELNNPLANIAARSGMLLSACKEPDQKMMLETIIDNASRGSEMIGDLMLIARPPEPVLREIDLDEFRQRVAEKGKFWSSQRGLKCELAWPSNLKIVSDESLLNEILWAVLRNAIEASPTAGTIRISALSEPQLFSIHVEDEGSGLSSVGLERCFDPYYSGREAGRGLGMGLTKAKRFAQLLGGDVSIKNLPTGGCRASISIRTHPDLVQTQPRAEQASE